MVSTMLDPKAKTMTDPKVMVISIDAPFLRVFAKRVVNKFRTSLPDLSGVLIIFPNQRNKFYFRRYLLEESKVPGIIPPVMKTIDEFIETIYESLGGRRGRLVNKIERNFILKRVVDTLKVEYWHELDFLRFIAVGDRLLTFFDELAKERLTLDRIDDFVKTGHYPERYVENELPILRDIYREYRQQLKARDYEDEIDKFGLVYNGFDPGLLKSYEYIFIAELAATTAVENKIIGEILKNSAAELVLHSGGKEELKTTSTDEPFYIHAKLLATLGIEESSIAFENTGESSPMTPTPPVYHIRSVATDTQQTLHLRTILERLKNRYEPHRIGIVLADETIVDSVTETLRSLGFEFNLSLGFPFTKSLLYSFLSGLFRVIDSGGHYQEFFAFVKHPLFKNGAIGLLTLRPMVYSLERFMTNERLNYFEAGKCPSEDFQPLVDLVKTCLSAGQAQLSFDRYIDGIAGLLLTILSYNHEVMKTHSAEIAEFFDRLTGLARLRLPPDPIEPGPKMLEFILRKMKTDTFNLFGDPMRGVQVVGLLEARNLDFDCVILPAMNEGVFPRKTEKDLFINHEVRRQIGLPYDKERDNLALYYFTALTRGKKEVYLSSVIEEKRDVRSRFVDFLLEKGAGLDESKLSLERQSVEFRPREIAKDKPLLDFLYKTITTKGLSPSALKDYKICPYRFYLRYLVNIREPDRITEEPSPLEWGSAVHDALKNFYALDFPEGFGEGSLPQAKAQVGRRLESALRDALAQKPKQAAFFDLEMWTRRVERFLEFELNRFEEGFKIDTSKLEKYLDDYITVGKLKIRLTGFVDRVDRYNGLYYIIDYKTGSLPAKKDYTIGDDFTEFQLPLYGIILTRGDFGKISDLAYYSIKKTTNIYGIKDRLATDIPSYLERFKKEILLPILETLIDPARPFEQRQSEDSCGRCAYADLCGTEHGPD
jgi:RecB family exonuclease